MKKILMAVLVCVASSFAAWDKFPVIEYGKGEAKFSYETGRQGNSGCCGNDEFKIRYSPLENLEFMSTKGYILGVRYQIIPVLSAGVDVGFPIPGTAWNVTPNAQFSMGITSALTLGSNVEVTIPTEDANKHKNGVSLGAGAEVDLSLSEKSMIWVGCDIETGLTKPQQNGNDAGEADGLGIYPGIGYIATVGPMSLGTFVVFGFGKDAGNDPMKTIIGFDAALKF